MVLVLSFGLYRINLILLPPVSLPNAMFHVTYHWTPDCSKLSSSIYLKIILIHVSLPDIQNLSSKFAESIWFPPPITTILISLSLVYKYPTYTLTPKTQQNLPSVDCIIEIFALYLWNPELWGFVFCFLVKKGS